MNRRTVFSIGYGSNTVKRTVFPGVDKKEQSFLQRRQE